MFMMAAYNSYCVYKTYINIMYSHTCILLKKKKLFIRSIRDIPFCINVVQMHVAYAPIENNSYLVLMCMRQNQHTFLLNKQNRSKNCEQTMLRSVLCRCDRLTYMYAMYRVKCCGNYLFG